MSDLESELHSAWLRVAANFSDDGHDLARRLARRRRAVLMRPPRAWCLALRASDSRLDDHTTIRPIPTADPSATVPRASLPPSSFLLDPSPQRVFLTAAGLQ